MRSVRLRGGLPPVTQIGDVVKELRRGILKSWGQLKSARPTICAEFARFDHFLRRPHAIEILAEGVGLKLPAPYLYNKQYICIIDVIDACFQRY
jgi:hypothetical protein